MSLRAALTGSIGMGKSTTAAMFAEEGVPVWDADAAVARLYGEGGAGVERIAALFPGAVRGGAVDRPALRARVADDPAALKALEAAIHPLVGEDRERFAKDHADAPVLLFDIPLLFETGAADRYDAVIVVTAPEEVQRERVLARPGMSEELLSAILARQTPDAEKRRRADHLVDTSAGLEPARARVREIVAALRRQAEA